MKKKIKKVNAAILIIGNEILSGRTQDKNVSFISNWLNSKCGISVSEVRIIPDIEKIIINNIVTLSKKFNYIFTTGGIGPTHDDITAKSISKAFKLKYEYHKEAYAILNHLSSRCPAARQCRCARTYLHHVARSARSNLGDSQSRWQ